MVNPQTSNTSAAVRATDPTTGATRFRREELPQGNQPDAGPTRGRYPVPADFPARVRAMRRENVWSLVDMATILECGKSCIAKWEQGGTTALNGKNYRQIRAHLPELLAAPTSARRPQKLTKGTVSAALGIPMRSVVPLALAALCRERGLL